VSLPHLLLVDDSEAVLAFERAALGGYYLLSTASNGREALERVAQLRPAAVLLDLSMPLMDGDQVLAAMQRDEALRGIPVIIVSSERRRAEACIRAGARAYLPKPIRARDLLPLVSRVLDEARLQQRAGDLAALLVGVGELDLGLPLRLVEMVLHQVATHRLPGAPDYLGEQLELHGQRVAVLDLARRLEVAHSTRVDERKLVLVSAEGARLALCVDRVRDPVEIPAADLKYSPPAAASARPLQAALVAMTEGPRGSLPIVDPHALVPREVLASLPALLYAAEPAA
jgi:CheY-like chemotaxis protein